MLTCASQRHTFEAKHSLDFVAGSNKPEIFGRCHATTAFCVLLKRHAAAETLPTSQTVVEFFNHPDSMRLEARKVGTPSFVQIEFISHGAARPAHAIFALLLGFEVEAVEHVAALLANACQNALVKLAIRWNHGVAIHGITCVLLSWRTR